MNSEIVAEIMPPPIDVVVYLNDNTGIMLSLQGGQDMRADQLFELVLQEMKVGGARANLYRNTFSLWFISDLLELQLKPSHIPFKLVCFWEELLEKYVQCSEEAKQRDEPMIILQRNVYMSKQQELEIDDEEALRLLYEEAHARVVQGRYSLEMDVMEECAVLQAQVMASSSTTHVGSSSFFLNHLKDLLPTKHCHRNWLWRKSHNIEHRLANLYHTKTQSAQPQPLLQLYRSYLGHCHKLSLYGSAFLYGQVENVVKKVDDAVIVCISMQGVALISCQEQTIIASIPFNMMSWQYAESSSQHETNTLPCLFLLFQHSINHTQSNKLLQIFSKSAILADNLIETFISLKKTLNINETPNEIYVDEKKVALAIFDKNGKKLRSSIRAPKDTRHPLV